MSTDTPIGADGQHGWRSQSNLLLAGAYRLQSAAVNNSVETPLREATVSIQLHMNTAATTQAQLRTVGLHKCCFTQSRVCFFESIITQDSEVISSGI